MSTWWHRNIDEPGKLPLLLTFAAFVVTFLVTRTITRMIRSGKGPLRNNIAASGLHVHHAVPGTILLIAGAFLAVGAGAGPWHLVAAVMIGVGTSLVLDEFALILHLEDVYWSAEGRVSVEMVSLAAGCLGFALVGFVPFGVDRVGPSELAARDSVIASTIATLASIFVCVRKHKFKLALFGIFVPAFAWVGALRLARPGSPWSRRYGTERAARAQARTEAFDRRWLPLLDRLSDLVAGSPSRPNR